MSKHWSKSFSFGAVAFVFLVIGYQSALFVHKAAVARVVSLEGADAVSGAGFADGAEVGAVGSAGVGPGGSVEVGPVGSAGAGPVGSAVETLRQDTLEGRAEGLAEGQGEGRTEGRTSDRAEARAEKQAEVRTERQAEHHAEVRAAIKNTFREKQEFTFNPNTASLEDFQKLGFSEKQAQSIVNYRVKGGHFYRKEDFGKSYVVSPEDYRRLESYISIPLLDINAADSAAFDALPGIGGFYARKMVEFRERLGGRYVAKEQLLDIYNFGQERYSKLEDLVYVGPGAGGGVSGEAAVLGGGTGSGDGGGTGSGNGSGNGGGIGSGNGSGNGGETGGVIEDGDGCGKPVLRLWSMPEDSLKLNPYIGSWKVAHQIALYKKSKPKGPWTVEDLAANGILPQETATKLARYYQLE